MRKILALLLTLCLLLSLCGCGGETENTASEQAPVDSPEPVTITTQGDYIIPDHWTETSINDGTYAYLTEKADMDTGYVNDGLGHLYQGKTDQENQTFTLSVYDTAKNPEYTLEIPFLAPVEDPRYQGDFLERYVILEDCVWIVHSHTDYDPETETSEMDGRLEKWDTAGNLLMTETLDHYDINDEENFVMDFTKGENNELLLLSQKEMLFLDKDGNIIKRQEISEDNWFQVYRDSSGRCYLFDSLSTSTLYTIDWENHGLGQPLFETGYNTRMLPGGGDYDFFLVNDTTLSGASLEAGTITEILSWSDYDLAGSVNSVSYVDEETLLITISSFVGEGESLYLRRVPADEVPEKTSIYMAVPLMYWEDVPDRTWTESLDQMITEQMNSFNRGNANYRIDVVTFGDATELQMLMQSDTPPDLICWDGDWLEEAPSAQVYSAKGYLVDLEPLVEADSELRMSDFIPRCVELIKETYGGLYLFPREFYSRTIVAYSEYVGDEMGWTMEEFCDIAKNLPQGMTIWGGDGKSLLNMLLETGISEFVDFEAGTCSFETQTFMDLLTVCRDKCGVEENWEEGLGNNLMRVEGVMGRFGQFAKEVMVPAREQGLTLIGYPGAGGNGMNLTFSGSVSITTVGGHSDVAWDFVRELMSYDFQKNSFGFGSVREDVFTEKEDSYAEMYPDDVTEADYAAAKALPYDAGCTTVYDSPVTQIVMEEADGFFAGDKSAEETARIIQNRVMIYLSEQS